jgi:hypothetical protein
MTAAAQLLTEYDAWVERQALVPRTRSAYRRWVHELVEHLEAGDELTAFLAQDGEHDRRAVVADWRRRLVDQRLAPSTINLALAAVVLAGSAGRLGSGAPCFGAGGRRDSRARRR